MGVPRLLVVLPASVIGGAETKVLNILHHNKSFKNILITHSIISDYFRGQSNDIYSFDNYGCNPDFSYSIDKIYSYARAIKTVAHIEKPDIILGVMHNGSLFSNIARDLFCLKSKVIGTIEGSLAGYFQMIGRRPKIYERLLIKYCLLRCDAIVVPSNGIKSELINVFNANRKKIITIYNGINIDTIGEQSLDNIDIQKDCPWIVTACRLGLQKDFKTLLNAFKIIRGNIKTKLVIIGDGDLREYIKKTALELSISDDLIMTGFQKNPFKYMSKADVFVLSSFFEGFGNVIVEAMALGVPVVSTDCPSGPGEIINDGENGFLVPMKDPQAMASKCLMILNDTSLRKNIAANALNRAKEFSVQAMSTKIESHLMKTLC